MLAPRFKRVQSFSDSSLEEGSVLSDLQSESSRELLENSVGCEEAPDDISDRDNVDVSVMEAGGIREDVARKRGAGVICTLASFSVSPDEPVSRDLFSARLAGFNISGSSVDDDELVGDIEVLGLPEGRDDFFCFFEYFSSSRRVSLTLASLADDEFAFCSTASS